MFKIIIKEINIILPNRVYILQKDISHKSNLKCLIQLIQICCHTLNSLYHYISSSYFEHISCTIHQKYNNNQDKSTYIHSLKFKNLNKDRIHHCKKNNYQIGLNNFCKMMSNIYMILMFYLYTFHLGNY